MCSRTPGTEGWQTTLPKSSTTPMQEERARREVLPFVRGVLVVSLRFSRSGRTITHQPPPLLLAAGRLDAVLGSPWDSLRGSSDETAQNETYHDKGNDESEERCSELNADIKYR